jgi:hypothetical protein
MEKKKKRKKERKKERKKKKKPKKKKAMRIIPVLSRATRISCPVQPTSQT